MIGIPSVLELLPVVVEKDKKTLLLVIVYRMTGPLGIFIDDFMLLINELPPQLRILIVGDFNSKFLWFKILTCISTDNIQLIYMEDYWILYLINSKNLWWKQSPK